MSPIVRHRFCVVCWTFRPSRIVRARRASGRLAQLSGSLSPACWAPCTGFLAVLWILPAFVPVLLLANGYLEAPICKHARFRGHEQALSQQPRTQTTFRALRAYRSALNVIVTVSYCLARTWPLTDSISLSWKRCRIAPCQCTRQCALARCLLITGTCLFRCFNDTQR